MYLYSSKCLETIIYMIVACLHWRTNLQSPVSSLSTETKCHNTDRIEDNEDKIFFQQNDKNFIHSVHIHNKLAI